MRVKIVLFRTGDLAVLQCSFECEQQRGSKRKEKYGYFANIWAVGCIILEVVGGESLKAAL